MGLGASAGGLEALEAFLRATPGNTGMAFIIVQHLSPAHKSHMVELLAKHTPMPVRTAEDGMPLAPDSVYLIPPKKVLTVQNRQLRLAERGSGLTLPVDVLFRSLAEEFGDRAAGVVLSGTGSDGMRGVRALKEVGGLVVVQDPATAKFDGMPRSAASAGIADYIVSVPEMPRVLQVFADHSEKLREALPAPIESADTAFEHLTGLLRRQTGVDFSLYKMTTIHRRLQRRMAIVQAPTLEEYVRLAQQSPREVVALFKELLISVTRFFRDPEHFEFLRREVIPTIAERTRPGESIRVWVAGCATGEEPYSLAMLFEEYFEGGGRPRDVKIFATDIDRDALEFAGAGAYPESIAADVTPERLNRFFVRRGDHFHVARFLRQRVVFANHDLTRDPPFSRVSLLVCRNLLIYFTPQLQTQVLSAFRFALRPGGFLFLGTSETPGELGDELQVVEAKAKVFRRTDARTRMPEYRRAAVQPRSDRRQADTGTELGSSGLHRLADASEVLLQTFVPPTVLVTEHHDVLHFFGKPSPLVQFPVGAATLNILHLVPPSVASVIGLATHRALRDDAEVHYRAVPAGEGLAVVTVRPVPGGEGKIRQLLVTIDVEKEDSLPELGTSTEVSAEAQRQIVDLQQELHYSRENLQATIEELETSNEELQATNEELVASNEELQSTNEELQSVNEELHTLNAEYQQKITELVRLNDDINNLLLSTRVGSVFLDAELRITRFTPAITQVMPLMERDIGRPLSHLSSEFAGEVIFSLLDDVRESEEAREKDFVASDGRSYLVRVAPYVTVGPGPGGVVITVIDVTATKAAATRLAGILDALPQHIALLDRTGTITHVNESWRRFALENAAPPEKTGVGADYLAVCREAASRDPIAGEVAQHLEALLNGQQADFQVEYPCHGPKDARWFLLQATALRGPEAGAVISHVNITARKVLQQELDRKTSTAP